MSINTVVVRCRKCDHTVETADRDKVGQTCDRLCDGTYRRVWTPPGIAFKGSGFTR